tara:strand:- start:2304 stop:2543 length:240 start_codon:yes stop_codon:yes gene_type:complete
MLDVLLVTMSLIAVVSMFFLCWLTWTLNEQLQNNDNVVNELQDEIDMLRKSREEDRKNWKLDNKLVKMYQKEKLEQNKQ